MLCRFVKALCPQQAIDTYTPDAWFEVLGHLELADCKKAVVTAARRKPFVAPAEIISEIAAVRSADKPHSNACRDGNHRDCQVSWCACTCHPAAVAAVTSPQPERPELPAGPKRFEPGALRIGRDVDP